MTSLVLPKQVRALRGRCLFVAEAIGGAIGPLAGGRAGTYILIGSHELAGDVARFLGVDGRAHGARQHRGVARHIGHDVRAGQQALQDAIEALEVGADRNFQRQDLLTLGIEEEGVGLIKLLGDQEDAVGSLDHGVDLVGVGHQHVLQLERKLYEQGLAHADRDPLGQGKVGADRHGKD